MAEQDKCELCGEPMPPGEEMFKFHGYSGPCPKPALARQPSPLKVALDALEHANSALLCVKENGFDQTGAVGPEVIGQVQAAIALIKAVGE